MTKIMAELPDIEFYGEHIDTKHDQCNSMWRSCWNNQQSNMRREFDLLILLAVYFVQVR
jgi:hypothetical protein